MNCPNCNYSSEGAILRCPGCSASFSMVGLEELQHLKYLSSRIQSWIGVGGTDAGSLERLSDEVSQEIAKLEYSLGITNIPDSTEEFKEPRLVSHNAAGEGPEYANISGFTPHESMDRPRRSFSWNKLADTLLSSMSLQSLLYIGTALLILSSIILLVLSWNEVNWVLRQAILFIGMITLLWTGYQVREKMGLRISGGAILDIGALWLPLNVGAIFYQFSEVTGNTVVPGLDLNLGLSNSSWMVISATTVPLFAYLAHRFRLRVMTYGVLTGIGATLFAGLATTGIPLEWQIAGVMFLGPVYVCSAKYVGPNGYKDLEPHVFWFSNLAMCVLGFSALGLVLAGESSDPAGTTALWFLTIHLFISYALYRYLIIGYLCAVALPFALVTTLYFHVNSLDLAWYNLILVFISTIYVILSKRFPRMNVWVPEKSRFFPGININPLYVVGGLISIIAAIWPAATIPSSAVTLYGLVVLYGALVYLFKQRVFAYIPVFLMPIPIVLTLLWVNLPTEFIALPFLPLFGAHVILGELALRKNGDSHRSIEDLANPTVLLNSLWARPLLLAGYIGNPVSVIVSWVIIGELSDYGTMGLLTTFDTASIWYGIVFVTVGIIYSIVCEIPSITSRSLMKRLYVLGIPLMILGTWFGHEHSLLVGAILAAIVLLKFFISLVLTRNTGWVYLIGVWLPFLFIDLLVWQSVESKFYTLTLSGLVLVYGLIGLVFKPCSIEYWRPHKGNNVGSFILPLQFTAFLFGILSIFASLGEAPEIIAISLIILGSYYLIATFTLRLIPLLYVTLIHLGAAYVLGITVLSIDESLYGPITVISSAVILAIGLLFDKHSDALGFKNSMILSPKLRNNEFIGRCLESPIIPFAFVAYMGTIVAILISLGHGWWQFASILGVASIYSYSSWHFQKPIFVYPALLSGHLSVLWAIGTFASDTSIEDTIYIWIPVTYTLTTLGLLVYRIKDSKTIKDSAWSRPGKPVVCPTCHNQADISDSDNRYCTQCGASLWRRWDVLRLSTFWALPFLFFAVPIALGSTIISSINATTGLVAGLGYLPILIIATYKLRSQILGLTTLLYVILTCLQALRLFEPTIANIPIYTSILAIVLLIVTYWLGIGDNSKSRWANWNLDMWGNATRKTSYILLGVAIVHGCILLIDSGFSRPILQSFVITTALTGVGFVGVAYFEKKSWITYIACSAILLALWGQLVLLESTQVQFFVVPVAIFLMAISYLERQRMNHIQVIFIEVTGLVILLGITLLQSLGIYTDGITNQIYGLILFFETLLVVMVGAVLRWKRTFFAGLITFVANLAVLLFDPLSRGTLSPTVMWSIFLSVGLFLVVIAVYLERNREKSSQAFRKVIDALNSWD